MTVRRPPGYIRDAIVEVFRQGGRPLTVDELYEGVTERLGEDVPRSSVRSYLQLNTPGRFERVGRGLYRLIR